MERYQEELFWKTYDIRTRYAAFYDAIYDILEKNSDSPANHPDSTILPHDITQSNLGLTITDLQKILETEGYYYSKEEINLIIYHLFTNEKRIIRKDFWDKEPVYEFLDRYYWESRLQQNFHIFKDENPTEKKVFALMSDTHIGLEGVYNPTLINNFYDYIIGLGVKRCFHLGDLFEGVKNFPISEKEKEYHRQIDIFLRDYPYPKVEELITYLTGGNHDEQIGLILGGCPIKYVNPSKKEAQYAPSIEYFKEEYNALRYITALNPSIMTIPQSKFGISGWSTTANGRDIHFNHELFISFMHENIKINSIEEIEKKAMFLDYNYDILISGHLHQGFVYSIPNPYKEEDNLYLSVPSTSSTNIGKAIGYIVELSEDGNNMEISVLGSDDNLNIHEIDKISWDFKKKNKTYSKLL